MELSNWIGFFYAALLLTNLEIQKYYEKAPKCNGA